MSQMWIRKHNSAGYGVSSQASGWALWSSLKQQPWPHEEMGTGFQYYICEPVNSKDRQIAAHATVTQYLPFFSVDSLGDAYSKLEVELGSSTLGPLRSEWMSNDYNVGKIARGRWPLNLAFWLINVTDVEPFTINEIMDFGQTGWRKVAADRIPAESQR